MDVVLFLLLTGVAAASLTGAVLLVSRDVREHSVARARALRDHDLAARVEPTLAKKVSLFALGLFAASLLTLPFDLGFATTFVVILLVSTSLYLAPDLLAGPWGLTDPDRR